MNGYWSCRLTQCGATILSQELKRPVEPQTLQIRSRGPDTPESDIRMQATVMLAATLGARTEGIHLILNPPAAMEREQALECEWKAEHAPSARPEQEPPHHQGGDQSSPGPA